VDLANAAFASCPEKLPRFWPKRRVSKARGAEPYHMHFVIVTEQQEEVKQEDVIGRGLLLWLLGIPLPIIILIWVLGGLHG
jgi:hypothetical protein